MTYWLRRPPQQRKPAPPTPSPLPAELLDEFHDRELGSGGEMLPVPEPAPPAPPIAGLQIEPPDWELEAAEAAERDAAQPPAPEVTLSALEAMKAEAGDFDPPEWKPIAPPMEPLVPWKPPEPDWRQEELERAQRDRKPPVLDEPEKSLRRWPA